MSNDTRNYDEDRTSEKNNFSWWPLLILPVMFAAGYGLRGAQDGADTTQYGVGGGPGSVPCTSTLPDSATLDGDSFSGEGMSSDPRATGTSTDSL